MATIDRLYGTGIDSPIETTRPVGFNWPSNLPEVIAYRNGDKWSCNLQPEDLWDTTAITQTYYVDGRDGVDANSGLTWALRKKTIRGALTAASTSGIDSRILVYSDNGKILYTRDKSWGLNVGNIISTVNVVIEAFDGRVSVGTYDSLTYTLTPAQTYTYQATRSNVARVFDPSIKNANGTYREYTWATSIANVEATEGSWFTDNVTTYVHPIGNGIASNYNSRAYLISPGAGWDCNKNLFVRGFDFESGQDGGFILKGGSTNKAVFDDCTFRYSAASNINTGGVTVSDGFVCFNEGISASFNCTADLNGKDGFNYHALAGVIPNALLVNCSGYRNGLYGSSNNGLTGHDGAKIIDIGGIWTSNRGTNSGHVSLNTQVWSVGSIAGNSAGDIILGGVIDHAGFGAWTDGTGGATLWLDSCKDIGTEIGVYNDGVGVVNARNHKGTGTRVGTIVSY